VSSRLPPPPPRPAARRARGAPDDGDAAADPGSPAARRRAARALGDAALARALASADPAVWAEFDARFRPLLAAYARRVRIPPALWPQCVDEVLEDEAMRLADGGAVPDQLAAYLVRSAYHRLLKARRAAARRERRYGAGAAEDGPPGSGPWADGAAERVVPGVCSAAALRASRGPRAADGAPAAWDDAGADASAASGVLARAAAALAARLTDAERQLLVWVAEQVPRRQIAEWVGDGYEATRKRILRLTRRLQADAARLAADLPPAERHEFERFLRRATRPGGPPASPPVAGAAGPTEGGAGSAARAPRPAESPPRAVQPRGSRP
jgi:DNA-binding CsgD family transcriptional regulator